MAKEKCTTIFNYKDLGSDVIRNLEEVQEAEKHGEEDQELMIYEQEDPLGDKEHEEENDVEDDGSEWEDNLVYVELDDVQNVDNLFKLKTPRLTSLGGGRVGKPNGGSHYPSNSASVPSTSTQEREQRADRTIEFSFHNFTSEEPILEFHGRYYTGKYEDPYGTGLLFRHEEDSTIKEGKSVNPILKKLTKDLDPPPHPVFGTTMVPTSSMPYELAGKVTKILKMKRTETRFAGDTLEREDETVGCLNDSSEESNGEDEVKSKKLRKIDTEHSKEFHEN